MISGDAPLDLAHLARQTADDEALAAELLMLFTQQGEVQRARIGDASAPRQARSDAAHTLKGAARAVGAWAVADAAEAIETALASGAEAPLQPLEQALAAAQDFIAGHLGPAR